MLDVYLDESCKDAHRYLVIGAICVDTDLVPDIRGRLRSVREQFGQFGEVKWSKCTRMKQPFFQAFADVFFDASAKDEMFFHALYVDCSTFDHHKFNRGDSDLGFNKLIYQLLLHKFGRRYGHEHPMHVYLDQRATKHQPEAIRPLLNSDLRRWGIATEPFRRLTFVDSAKSDLIQLNDLLVGTIGFTKNRHDKRQDCAAHKVALKDHIVKRALANDHPHRLNWASARRFCVWPFRFHKR